MGDSVNKTGFIIAILRSHFKLFIQIIIILFAMLPFIRRLNYSTLSGNYNNGICETVAFIDMIVNREKINLIGKTRGRTFHLQLLPPLQHKTIQSL